MLVETGQVQATERSSAASSHAHDRPAHRPRRLASRRLRMRIAVISDIHANLHALEAVLADIDRRGADEIWCLGDVVGYGPRPNECVDLVRERADALRSAATTTWP